MGTLKSSERGGRDHALARTKGMRVTSAASMHSDWPWKRLRRKTMEDSSGTYLALPIVHLILHLAVLLGTGIFKVTEEAKSFSEKVAVHFTLIDTLVWPSSWIAAMMRKGRLMLSVTLYFMSSNSPSGGMKVIVRSASKRPRETQRWKVQSSMLTPDFPALAEFLSFSTTSLSLRPNLHSGMPVSFVFIMTLPVTSWRRTDPVALNNRLTDSRTSMYTSFLLCLMPSLRQSIAPVIWDVREPWSSAIFCLCLPRLMYILRTSMLVFWG
mmetsp:Transcript_19767/g.36789  ORF Transcript_19767/g.36789 Transcript_19767/m.36789 type:complete len:268 (-) Transcript_19767:563-1366(-)